MLIQCWDDLLKGEKSGIARFFPDKLEGDPKIAEASVKAAEMVGKIMQHGCMKETAIQLSLLALYDVVLLVGTFAFPLAAAEMPFFSRIYLMLCRQ